ncbi:ERC protein 2-like isoform X1 [Anopheles darlingi]|uniref:Putative ubiquitin-conjugating enzyme e2q-like protein n=1 Tax=Anopheles darlingi TaxID=43151 RepID=A0A2M4CZP9_ANODA|nr:ERC protein 2-like isoform X1 [Anopheles darlingi]
MLSPGNLDEIKERISKNEEKINVLQAINNVLKERHEIESNYKNLAHKFREMQEEEAHRRAKVCSVRDCLRGLPHPQTLPTHATARALQPAHLDVPYYTPQFDEARKKQLAELQAKGEALCREKAKLQHQIEHVTWHLEGCRRRRPCLARLPENCPLKGDAPSCLPHSPEKLKIMASMKSTADHLVRSIMDLRKKIHIVQDKLEHEVARKKEMEKKLAELRKEICRHNKCMQQQQQQHQQHQHHSHHHHAQHGHHHHHHHHTVPGGGGGGAGGGHGTTSLPPISKNCIATK